jgi:hypothetical protein
MTGANRGIMPAAVGAWLTYLVLDFLVHALFLAKWWHATEASWLPPVELARRIPIASGGFAVYCAGLIWLLVAVYGQLPTIVTGLRFGALVGVLFGLASTLGMYSLLPVPAPFVLVGTASTAFASAGSGSAAAWVLGGARRWKRVGAVFGAALVLFVVGVAAQNLVLSGLRTK